ncbi:MAG: hypothetical protein AABM41_03395 [Chloroflexota bacterium]
MVRTGLVEQVERIGMPVAEAVEVPLELGVQEVAAHRLGLASKSGSQHPDRIGGVRWNIGHPAQVVSVVVRVLTQRLTQPRADVAAGLVAGCDSSGNGEAECAWVESEEEAESVARATANDDPGKGDPRWGPILQTKQARTHPSCIFSTQIADLVTKHPDCYGVRVVRIILLGNEDCIYRGPDASR